MSFTQKYCTWLLIALTVFVVLKEASSGSSVSTEAEETLCPQLRVYLSLAPMLLGEDKGVLALAVHAPDVALDRGQGHVRCRPAEQPDLANGKLAALRGEFSFCL